MKATILLLSIWIVSATGQDCPFPHIEACAGPTVTNAVSYTWEQRPDSIRFLHWAESNRTYEVQFARDVTATQWLAYSRITLSNRADWLSTWVPIYSCEPAVFYRVRVE